MSQDDRSGSDYQPINLGCDWAARALQSAVNSNLRFQEILAARRVVLQTGKVPADKISSRIDTGVQVAIALQNALKINHTMDRVLLVDDCHAPNTLDYAAYLEALSAAGFKPRVILFESSPLLYEIALDILNYLEAAAPSSRRFRVMRKDAGAYVELLGRTGHIELLRGIEPEAIVESLLFDVAVTLYTRYRKMLSAAYSSKLGCPRVFDIHRGILDYYLMTEPSRRVPRPFYASPYVSDQAEAERPYIALIKSRNRPPLPSSVIVNVVESYHRPVHAKVNQVLEFLGEEPVYSLYYDSSGRVELETSRFTGPETRRQEKVPVPFFSTGVEDKTA